MRIVHTIFIHFGEDDVFWFQCYAPQGTYARGVHRNQRQVPCFLNILSASMTTFPTLQGSLSVVSTSSFMGESLVFSLSPTRFCHYGLALFAIGLSLTCGLATTLDLAVYCTTAIIPEFVYCALVNYGLLSVYQLATTPGIVICCNTAIRPESVYCTLVAFRQTSIHYSTTTLGLAVRCYTTIRPKSIHCVLAVSRLLPICSTFFRP